MNQLSNILQLDLEVAFKPDVLGYVGPLPITNGFLSGLLVTFFVLIFALFFFFTFKRTGTPTKFQLVMEDLYGVMYAFVGQIAGSPSVAKAIFPIIATLFIYIGLANALPILPIYDSITATSVTGEQVSLFRPHTIDLSTTLGIAAAIVISTHIASIAKNNIFGHLDKYLGVSVFIKAIREGSKQGPGGLLMELFTAFISLFVSLLDFVSDIFKALSLSLRLFGNIFAGALLSALVLGAFSLVFPAILNLYSVAVGILQAIVFGALSASYFGVALNDD